MDTPSAWWLLCGTLGSGAAAGDRTQERPVGVGELVARARGAQDHVEDGVGLSGVAVSEPCHVRLDNRPPLGCRVLVLYEADVHGDGAGQADPHLGEQVFYELSDGVLVRVMVEWGRVETAEDGVPAGSGDAMVEEEQPVLGGECHRVGDQDRGAGADTFPGARQP